MIRAFLALDPPEDIRARLTVLQFLLPLPRRVDPADFHLTLTWLGEVPDPVLAALDDDLSGLRAAPFALNLASVGLFGGGAPRAVWAGLAPCEPLTRLQARTDRLARQAGARIEARRFLPHVTLGRFAPPAPDAALRLERAVVAEAGFRAGPWPVTTLTLFRSWPSVREGPRYERLADYPLV
ncbi:MAG: RNA 2',3'-cyclic phosphodiesterase [Gemmobacter sp.]